MNVLAAEMMKVAAENGSSTESRAQLDLEGAALALKGSFRRVEGGDGGGGHLIVVEGGGGEGGGGEEDGGTDSGGDGVLHGLSQAEHIVHSI
ncbi:Hypothetical predicted protein [Olea europaea subsp. europaea]|uniref:Uncharacterized protein n=1 Tax=Olea europaea subsp. europaea TaxID=158383 RepID=A0A8S0RXN9_OLEEU|nr:Hypothetical predicted protein [Olea europaea subsp. europaea]